MYEKNTPRGIYIWDTVVQNYFENYFHIRGLYAKGTLRSNYLLKSLAITTISHSRYQGSLSPEHQSPLPPWPLPPFRSRHYHGSRHLCPFTHDSPINRQPSANGHLEQPAHNPHNLHVTYTWHSSSQTFSCIRNTHNIRKLIITRVFYLS